MKTPISNDFSNTLSVRYLVLLALAYTAVTLNAGAQTISPYIVVDQFGYRPTAEKIAVIRNPEQGLDSAMSFTPGTEYAVLKSSDFTEVFTGTLSSWKNGEVDASSGDQCWWFDFSQLEEEGTYFLLDKNRNVRSADFEVGENVYAEVLKQAMRTFFYQRAGFAKEARYAHEAWKDEASHLGKLQDPEARRFDAAFNAFTERDLRGGWYDAGDYNKYTPWTADYIWDLLRAFEENPQAWADDYCLPYSGNGIPDILDEIKWGMDFLLRLQEPDGSLISIVSLDEAAPPSEATGQSLYGNVNTTSALAAAGAYAYGAKVFAAQGQTSYSDSLIAASELAWQWAIENPRVIWRNNDAAYNSIGIGAGQQETDDYGRFAYKIRAAVHLFETTQKEEYKSFVDENYKDLHLFTWDFAYPFEQENQDVILYYAQLPQVAAEVSDHILTAYKNAMTTEYNFGALSDKTDPYNAYIKDYGWGSNQTKSRKGLMFSAYQTYDIDAAKRQEAMRAAEGYIHYVHGLNPLGFCYLSNMYDYGADRGVTQFYHAWFADGTDWDVTGESKYGPAPGFLVGGANPFYEWDDCCPNNCSGRVCDQEQRSRLQNQPHQKSFDDFNTNWPMNSWEITENHLAYQVAYVRLMANFVDVTNYSAACDIDFVEVPLSTPTEPEKQLLYPNPTNRYVFTNSEYTMSARVFDLSGRCLVEQETSPSKPIDLEKLKSGTYVIYLVRNGRIYSQSLVVKQGR